jgi:hypothetical protein
VRAAGASNRLKKAKERRELSNTQKKKTIRRGKEGMTHRKVESSDYTVSCMQDQSYTDIRRCRRRVNKVQTAPVRVPVFVFAFVSISRVFFFFLNSVVYRFSFLVPAVVVALFSGASRLSLVSAFPPLFSVSSAKELHRSLAFFSLLF